MKLLDSARVRKVGAWVLAATLLVLGLTSEGVGALLSVGFAAYIAYDQGWLDEIWGTAKRAD